MRFEIIGQWKDGYEHDGLLYCAQRIEEMLMNYTSHLYKVPVFNSFLLCTEYLRESEKYFINGTEISARIVMDRTTSIKVKPPFSVRNFFFIASTPVSL